jgi:hypothetical protein
METVEGKDKATGCRAALRSPSRALESRIPTDPIARYAAPMIARVARDTHCAQRARGA